MRGLHASEEHPLSAYEEIENIKQLMGSTELYAPINSARKILAELDDNAGRNVVCMLSDGQTHTTELDKAAEEAKALRDLYGATLFALGVGRDVDEQGLGRLLKSACVMDDGPLEYGSYFCLRKMKNRG
mmetsp:Transcript_6782/g.16483  ORF Transcript_6782/g.16483 Transcript_6782/m.16483 type:complete len:129 (-) Transcript_6782:264-650(-)